MVYLLLEKIIRGSKLIPEWFPSNGYEPADVAVLEAYIGDDLTKPDYHAEIWIAIK